jgi:hypothetical protein
LFDLFILLLADLPLKVQRETMEWPFFSLQKRKRVRPIECRIPDGETWVKIEAIPCRISHDDVASTIVGVAANAQDKSERQRRARRRVRAALRSIKQVHLGA